MTYNHINISSRIFVDLLCLPISFLSHTQQQHSIISKACKECNNNQYDKIVKTSA